MRSEKQVQITTWAPRGTTPTFKSGRWVQLGAPSILNYWMTGLPGGKIYVINRAPFFRFERNNTEFANHATMLVDANNLIVPCGLGPDGWAKALFRQRRLK